MTPHPEKKCCNCKLPHGGAYYCPTLPKEEVQESSESDSWEEEFDRKFPHILSVGIKPASFELKDWIRTKRNMWCEDAADVAFANGSSIARSLALQEAASAVRGMKRKDPREPVTGIPDYERGFVAGAWHGHDRALEDAAREIEKLATGV